ncbi:hypothetical protein [Paraburkholderia caribensis]|uniref:hypothetical protein n=1 Tax=Paraburkholderia caribensis TaxID=75105 RepID=UPI0034D1623E
MIALKYGAPPAVTALTAVETNAVVASCVVLVPAVAVGAVGVPVNAGDASGAAPVTFATGTLPHAGAVLAPVETIALPTVDPAGLISWTGTVVAPNAIDESASSAETMSLFIFMILDRCRPQP